MRTRAPLAPLVALAVLVGTFAAGAPARGDSLQRALSDTQGAPTPAAALATLRSERSFVCPAGSRPARRPRAPSTRSALRRATLLLAAHSSQRKVASLLRSRPLARGNAVALAGLGSGKPAVALAGFLAEHARHPRDPLALLDAAVVLSRLGHQPEALALLDAAQRMRAPSAQLGTDVRALIDNARGVALFRLKRFSDAAVLFRGASRRAPRLPHPKRNLAAALLCQGRAQAAVAPYIDGTYSDPVHTQAPAASSPTTAKPVPADALDLSRGVAGALPALKLPPTADAGADSEPLLSAAFDRISNQGQQAGSRVTQLLDQLSAEQTPLLKARKLLTIARTDAVIGLSNDWQTNRPDLAALYAKVQADDAHMRTISPGDAVARHTQDVHNACVSGTNAQIKQCDLTQCGPVVRSAHSDWLPQAQAYDNDVRAWATEFYRYKSALGANLHSAAAAGAITAGARQQMLVAFQAELLSVSGIAGFDALYADCLNPPDPSLAAADDDKTTAPDADLCPTGLSGVKLSLALGVMSVSVSCEAVGADFSLPDPISPYVGIKYGFASGSTTALVGVKGGIDIGTDVKASAKGGIYMTWDAAGRPTDVGVQVSGPGISGKFDQVKIGNADEPKLQVSLVDYLL